MGKLKALSIVLSLVFAGCVYKPPAIPLIAEPGSLEALVGEWTGDYVADDGYERSGRISFTLIAGEDQPHGDVLMVPKGTNRGYERYQGDEPARGDAHGQPSKVLTIRFVRVIGGSVSGLLDTYWDPDRNCRVSTTFYGDLKGNVIEGTFRSHFTDFRSETTGEWRVTRRIAGR